MRKGSLIERYSYLVHLSVMLTQMVHRERGFRLRDVKFYCNLVSNWISFDGQGYEFDIELMQIKRMLEQLMERGWVSLPAGSDGKHYQLGHQGFVGMLENLRQQSTVASIEEVLLLSFVFETYQPFLKQYLLRVPLSPEEKKQLEALIDPDWFLENYLEHIDRRIEGIQRRIDENAAMTDFIRASQEAHESFPAIVDKVHRKFSYQLSYAKTFRELLLEIPEEMGRYELTHGLERRNSILFVALRDHYEQRRSHLTQHLAVIRAARRRSKNHDDIFNALI